MNFISTVTEVFIDICYFFWPLTIRHKLIRFLILLAAIITLLFFVFKESTPQAEPVVVKPQVTTGTVASVLNTSASSFIGTLRSVSEAQIQSEVGGRVTSVQVEAGSPVKAGSIIATIENASERAAVLQAQGAYEAALTGSAAGEVSVESADLALTNAKKAGTITHQSTFISVDTALHNVVDDYFTLENGIASGFKLEGKGQAPTLNTRRTSLETLFSNWSKKIGVVNEGTISAELDTIYKSAKEIVSFVEVLSLIAQDADITPSYSQTQKDADVANINAARVSLNSVLSQIEGAKTQIDNAQKSLEQARLAGAKGLPSASSAQTKIALGSLRSAQANLEKTILRSPISGTVDVLRVKTGDYISAFTPVAQVSSTGGLEVSIFVGERDLPLFAVGNTVTINGSATGTVVNIAPSIDPLTFKAEVKIALENTSALTTGSTVTVSLVVENINTDSRLLVPITAVKFNAKDGFLFTVEDGKLKSMPVVLGPIVGSLVTIVSGIDRTTEFVIDARGKAEGQQVEVTQ